MREILPGVHHWAAFHSGIGTDVSSYYVEPCATALDPMLPEEGLDWFEGRPLERVVLTNRHHLRAGERFAEDLGVPVLVNENGLHEIEGRLGVRTFAFGDEVAPGMTAHGVHPGWPDEGVLHIAVGDGVLAIADGAIRYGGQIGFVPDQYLGDDPEEEKTALKDGYRRLLDLDFDALLFAHGDPLPEGGKAALREFVGD